MKVYIAAPWKRKDIAREARATLANVGIESTAGWIDFEPAEEISDPAAIMATEAVKDFRDIRKAEAFILLNVEHSEGKAVETGYALALNKPVFLVGERTNVFHHHPSVVMIDSVDQIVDAYTIELKSKEGN